MPRRALQQTHHLNRPVSRDEQLPLPRTVPETPAEARSPRLQLLRAQHSRLRSPQRETHLSPRGPLTFVVAAFNRHVHAGAGKIHHTQHAALTFIAAGVEDRHVMTLLAIDIDRACDLVHGGQESVHGADVRRWVYVEAGVQLQAPVPLSVAQPAGQALRRIALLQITGVEMGGRFRLQGEGDRSVPLSGVVGAVNAHRPCGIGAVDDPGKPLLSTGCGHQQRDDVRRGLWGSGGWADVDESTCHQSIPRSDEFTSFRHTFFDQLSDACLVPRSQSR